ncbi:MAG: hypothetical protein ACYTHJ_07105 [Planctomycetota bacterium]
MPGQDCVRRYDCCHFVEQFATEDLSFDRQASALIVRESYPLTLQLGLQDFVFFLEIGDYVLLLAVNPACH